MPVQWSKKVTVKQAPVVNAPQVPNPPPNPPPGGTGKKPRAPRVLKPKK